MSAHMPLPGSASPLPASPNSYSPAVSSVLSPTNTSTNGGPTPHWVAQTQSTLATLIRFPPLKPKLLERPPFAYVHDILSAIHKRSLLFDNAAQTGIEERLWNIHSLQAKSNRILFVEKIVTFLSNKLSSPLNVDARDVVECRNCEQTCEMLRHAATLGLACLRGDRASDASSHVTPQKQPQQQQAQWPPVQTPQPAAFGSQQRDLSPNAANRNGNLSSLPNQASSADEEEEKESKQPTGKQSSGFTPLGRLEPMDKQHIRPINLSSPISSTRDVQLRQHDSTSPRNNNTKPKQTKKNYDLMMSSSDEEEKQVKPSGSPVSPAKSTVTTHLPPPINPNARIQLTPSTPTTTTPKTPASQEVPPLTLLESKQLFAMFIPITSLTPERLSNPSFDFIHELLVNVCEKTGFLDQVLTPDQMILDKLLTDPPAQRLLLANVIRYVGLAVNHKCGVTPFTLLDGLHSYDSHIFLQNVARACLDPGLHMPTLLRRFEDGEDPLEETALDQIRENVAAQLAASMSPAAANTKAQQKQQQQRTPTYIVSTLSALRTLADDSESNVSEKNLRLVTFDTLHHIVQLIIEKTGFLTGLFSYESSHLSYFRNMSSARETYAEEKLYLEKLIAFMHLALPPPGVEITSDEIMNASTGRMDESQAEQNGYARAVNTFIQQVVYTAVDPDVDLGLLLKRYSDKYPSSSPLARHAAGQRRAPQQPVAAAVIAAAHTHASSIDDGMDVFAASQPWEAQGSLAASRLTNKRGDDQEFAAVKRGAAPPLQSLIRSAEEVEDESANNGPSSSSAAGFAQGGGEGWIMNPSAHARVNPAAAAAQPNAEAQWAVLSPRAAEMAKQEAQLIKQAHENDGLPTGGKKLNKGLAPLPAEPPESAASSSSLPKKHLDSLVDGDDDASLHKAGAADSLFDAEPISANVRAALAVHKTPFTSRPLILAKNYTYQYAASFTLGLAMILTVVFWRIFPPPKA